MIPCCPPEVGLVSPEVVNGTAAQGFYGICPQLPGSDPELQTVWVAQSTASHNKGRVGAGRPSGGMRVKAQKSENWAAVPTWGLKNITMRDSCLCSMRCLESCYMLGPAYRAENGLTIV